MDNTFAMLPPTSPRNIDNIDNIYDTNEPDDFIVAEQERAAQVIRESEERNRIIEESNKKIKEKKAKIESKRISKLSKRASERLRRYARNKTRKRAVRFPRKSHKNQKISRRRKK